MSVKLTTNLSQRLVLTPQLRQRIEMLQMTTIELSELIQQQLLENPILEEVTSQEETRELAEKILDQLAAPGSDSSFDNQTDLPSPADTNGHSAASAEDFDTGEAYGEITAGAEASEFAVSEQGEDLGSDEASRDSFEEIDYGREFQDYLDPGYKTQEFEYKEDAPTFDQFLTRPPSLADHLEWQLQMSAIEGDVREAALHVIGNLDADGRLVASNEELADQGGWSPEVVEEARQCVMHLDPVGCGARDARECLVTQLEAQGDGDRL